MRAAVQHVVSPASPGPESTSEASQRAYALRLMKLHGVDLEQLARLLIGAEVLARLVVVSVIATASRQAAASQSSETGAETRRVLARLVFVACWTEPGGAMAAQPGANLTNEFGRWIATTSQYQRAALALYLYGCHSAGQAGSLLNLPLYAVHRLLAGALLELAGGLPNE